MSTDAVRGGVSFLCAAEATSTGIGSRWVRRHQGISMVLLFHLVVEVANIVVVGTVLCVREGFRMLKGEERLRYVCD